MAPIWSPSGSHSPGEVSRCAPSNPCTARLAFTGNYEGENLEDPIFIDVTKATFKKDISGNLVSITFSSKLGGGADDTTVFSGALNGTLTKK
jgi:hypothetical protein